MCAFLHSLVFLTGCSDTYWWQNRWTGGEDGQPSSWIFTMFQREDNSQGTHWPQASQSFLKLFFPPLIENWHCLHSAMAKQGADLMARPDEVMFPPYVILTSLCSWFQHVFVIATGLPPWVHCKRCQKAASYLLSHLSHTLVYIILSLAKGIALAAT